MKKQNLFGEIGKKMQEQKLLYLQQMTEHLYCITATSQKSQKA